MPNCSSTKSTRKPSQTGYSALPGTTFSRATAPRTPPPAPRTPSPPTPQQKPLPAAQPPSRIRHQDPPPPRLRRDPRRQDYRRSEEVAIFFDRLAGVEADADVQRLSLALGEGPLEGDGAFDGLRHRPERRHEAVAHRFHLGAAVRLQHLSGDDLVLAEDVSSL